MEVAAFCDRTRGPLREQRRCVQKHDHVGEPGQLRRLSCLLYVKPRVCVGRAVAAEVGGTEAVAGRGVPFESMGLG